ncbi:hypothetical protein BDZ90DRAFT_226289 [Jaminaea rosea]|uniref:Uncharacterized protein n=1 Tax=Jaminaea rosea TaxID=1569628 RepID=A0A316UXJ3_9BASI|nr:hypothetical protein BDZ90DRAFT_226289 [Jaminaea rosea]PWN29011.1 hypothetical protein BDZ90DRAFT_226289 [Jaminaea rosea]
MIALLSRFTRYELATIFVAQCPSIAIFFLGTAEEIFDFAGEHPELLTRQFEWPGVYASFIEYTNSPQDLGAYAGQTVGLPISDQGLQLPFGERQVQHRLYCGEEGDTVEETDSLTLSPTPSPRSPAVTFAMTVFGRDGVLGGSTREWMTKLAKNLTGKDISSLDGDMEMMWLAIDENVVAAVIDTMHLHYPKFELIREERCQGRRITRCLNTNVPPCAAVARPRKRKADDRFR